MILLINRRAMSSSTMSVQVVPDIDDQVEEKHTDPSNMANVPTKPSELEQKLQNIQNQASNRESNRAVKHAVSHRRIANTHPPIRRMNCDAEPLSQSELMAHRLLLAQHMN